MKLGFVCSDIALSLSASLNALAAGSLPCSLRAGNGAAGFPAVSRPSIPPEPPGGSPSRGLDTGGWRLQSKASG
jgi:hypothetical protein